MTNSEIIFEVSCQLMREGKLKGTGHYITLTVEKDGKTEERRVEIPEEIHTFAAWKQSGFVVKKGEHSNIKFPIWKYVATKKSEEMDDGLELAGDTGRMIMKTAHFFTRAQVEAINGAA